MEANVTTEVIEKKTVTLTLTGEEAENLLLLASVMSEEALEKQLWRHRPHATNKASDVFGLCCNLYDVLKAQ